jgi:hypothetical protein
MKRRCAIRMLQNEDKITRCSEISQSTENTSLLENYPVSKVYERKKGERRHQFLRHNVYPRPNTVRAIKSERMKLVGRQSLGTVASRKEPTGRLA